MKLITRWGRAFGLFWWDFLVGDTPELFVATLVIVGTALLLGHQHVSGFVVLPALAILFLVASAYRGRRRAK
ncbi:MAG TPA: hypothetical protein VGH31_06885 [Acidimicrobiales bacterium]